MDKNISLKITKFSHELTISTEKVCDTEPEGESVSLEPKVDGGISIAPRFVMTPHTRTRPQIGCPKVKTRQNLTQRDAVQFISDA